MPVSEPVFNEKKGGGGGDGKKGCNSQESA